MEKPMQSTGPNADHRFVDYYARQSASEQTRQRFEAARRVTLAMRARLGRPTEALDVVDVGCGAGAQAMMWAQAGHRAQGIDISAPLIDLARERAEAAGLAARFQVGHAGRLPLPDRSVDIVLVSELLEHLEQWQPCVDEAMRIVRPGGVLYMSTTNRLCPVQQEFNLPGYSWYPRPLKKHCEKLAVTTHGRWVQYTSYPAVHWFSYYQLRDYLDAGGFTSEDRFDAMDTAGSGLKRAAVAAIRAAAPLRFAAHVLTPYTMIVAFRRA
jgi:2-polyprenyl-6-hydroxyphenyl methylase/3-demethylubiquinone-9 3-methyltransferase